MKRISTLLFLVAFLLTSGLFAQMEENHVKWASSIKKTAENEYLLAFTGTPDAKWHFYGVKDELNPFKFKFDQDGKIKVIGGVMESPKAHVVFDDIMEANRAEFEGTATMAQKIQVVATEDFTLTGYLDYQACIEDGMCIMEKHEFKFDIEGATEVAENDTNEEEVDTLSANVEDSVNTAEDTSLAVVEADVDTTKTEGGTVSESKELEDLKKMSLWTIFWIAFGWGLIAIFTPCVLPMIPMTVTFFMKSSEDKAKGRRQAIFYGISIVVIFTVIGSILSMIFGPRLFQWFSTHWFPNVLFFLIFMIFAAAFFGMFEIRMPSWIINKSDAQADKGGWLGPFFMAFTLVLVSFSCTVPIIGMVVVLLSDGEILQPIIAMFGFGMAFALPFTGFALFPAYLNRLPKSGGWMNAIKVCLGFIEVALGLKFLSVADMTYHWGILDREIYLALWIVIFTLMGFYLLGKIKFPHDSDMPYIKFPRLMLVIVTFAFVVYLIPGMFGAPLKALSGWIPPMASHDFNLPGIIMENAGSSDRPDLYELCEEPKYKDKIHSPHGIKGYYDYEQGLKCAAELNMPVFIDFSGHGCVNCRKMEEQVWSEPEVLKYLRSDYIVIQLYTDDRTELPESEWTPASESDDGRVKKTIGDKWGDYQITRFKQNSQPQYILLGPDGEMLIDETRAYDPDVDEYVRFLQEGLDVFEKKYK